MAVFKIQNPTAKDRAIAYFLNPPTAGVHAGPGGLVIPSDWNAQLLAGSQGIPGVTYDSIHTGDIDNSLAVGAVTQARAIDSNYTTALLASGLCTSQDFSDFKARCAITAGFPKRVLFMGDSITQGFTTDVGANICNGYRLGGAAIADPRGRCVYVGSNTPATVGNTTASRPTWYHSGNGGWTTQQHVDTAFLYGTGAGKINFDICFLLIGTNDAEGLIDLATWKTRYNNLLSALHTNVPAAVFVGCLIPRIPDPSSVARDALVVQYNNELSRSGGIWDTANGSGITIAARVDFSGLTTGAGDYDSDLLHPSVSGYAKMATLAGAGLTTALTSIGGP